MLARPLLPYETKKREASMDIQHITLTAEEGNRLPLFADQAAYLEALHRLGAVYQGCLALFALVGEHLHLVVQAPRERAGRLAQATISTLTPIVATPFASSYIRAVKSRSHMRWLLRYLLEQAAKHGMPGPPALWVGSCLPDLVGARIIDGLALCIGRVLPDYDVAQALRIVGIAASEVPPASQNTLRLAGASRIKLASAAVLGVDPSLCGNKPAVRLARRATAQLAARVGIGPGEVIAALERSPKTMWRLYRPEVDVQLLKATARRITLEDLVQQH
jgi:hypothetical protein